MFTYFPIYEKFKGVKVDRMENIQNIVTKLLFLH